MNPAWKQILPHRPLHWVFLALALSSVLIQAQPQWQILLIYDRGAVLQGQWWRLWTGHWVHFGWPHCVADTGLFLILGFILKPNTGRFVAASLLWLPPLVSLSLLTLDPGMTHYAGLSALDLGLLLLLALQGWREAWRNWFWIAVLAIYIGEIFFEAISGGHGGGMIPFDDPAVRVATEAHLASAVGMLVAWCLFRHRLAPRPSGRGGH